MTQTKTTPTSTPADKKTASVFETLSKIDVSKYVEQKKGGNGPALTYLSWAWAWHFIKTNYPDAFYTIYEREDGTPYWTDGKTCWVKTGVTIQGLEHIEYLPILNQAAHASLPLAQVTSWDVNKAIQRSLTKAAARHGLGLYIYAGEDLPLSDDEEKQRLAEQPTGTARRQNRTVAKKEEQAPAAPAPLKKSVADLTPEKYKAWVVAAAENKILKTGMPARDGFISLFHPTQDEMDYFDEQVFNLRMETGTPANQPTNA